MMDVSPEGLVSARRPSSFEDDDPTDRRPLLRFEDFHFVPALMTGVRGQGYETPTPIQAQAIAPALQGRDVLGLAQTGTGKTAAFALPILQRLSAGPRGVVRALVLAPTRELAEQIRASFEALGKQTGLRAISVYGGVSANTQAQALRGRCEIVVACPGRLLDHMGRGIFSARHLEVLVLDEADQMFDMGFLPDVRRILSRLPPARQTLLFSATMPDALRHLAHECLKNPVTVSVAHAEPLATVSHALYPVVEHLKTPLLLELIRRAGSESILVFTRTKHRAKKVAGKVSEAGWSATDLQGNLSQNRRRAAMDGFRAGKIHVLVATDIAARGIDVSQITHVINYDIPDTPEAYTHRIGRTGRAAKSGDAYTLVVGEDEGMIRIIERRMGRKIERRAVENFDYRAAPASNQAPKRAHPGGSRHGGRSFWRRRRRPR
jgi:ATP-dependent RNA helicase RhlE